MGGILYGVRGAVDEGEMKDMLNRANRHAIALRNRLEWESVHGVRRSTHISGGSHCLHMGYVQGKSARCTVYDNG